MKHWSVNFSIQIAIEGSKRRSKKYEKSKDITQKKNYSSFAPCLCVFLLQYAHSEISCKDKNTQTKVGEVGE